jgi:hypothetical protein
MVDEIHLFFFIVRTCIHACFIFFLERHEKIHLFWLEIFSII